MDKIFSYITKNLLAVVGVTILTGTTLTTSALGVIKVANNFEKIKVEVPEVKEMESVLSPTTIPTPISNSVSGGLNTVIPHPKVLSPIPTTGLLIPTTPAAQSRTTSSKVQCSVTLFGKQYDVTNLRSTHSGGNIFNCGTDMTAIYQGRHGSDLSRMQQYLITSGGTTSSSSSSSSNGSNNTSSNSGNTSNSSSSSTSGSSSSDTEIHKEEEHKNEREEKNEDHKEEEKERLESFIHNLLQLVVS
ncbi:MAG: hypothetical protein NTZ55_02165 [Candidatus Roizmanbacteria bacterium]|nr:hypothetical protein [Candidatus Roizmanbacteria bacterium]